MKRKKKKPNGAKKCAAKTAAGKPCGAYPVKGSDKCRRHSGGAQEDGRKGGQATGAMWAGIKADMEKCDILASGRQAIFMNALIVRELRGDNRWQALNAYMGHLIKLTQAADTVGVVVINRTIIPPE